MEVKNSNPKSFLEKYEFFNIFIHILKFLFQKIELKTLPAGFEPAAHCLEGSCSIQLS